MTRYHVVVRDRNSWSSVDGLNIVLRKCGHKHKTVDAAEQCMLKLLNPWPRRGPWQRWSADWHNAKVEQVREDGR